MVDGLAEPRVAGVAGGAPTPHVSVHSTFIPARASVVFLFEAVIASLSGPFLQ